MDSLQTATCTSFLENSTVGTEVPHDTPGTLGSWVEAWAKCVGLAPERSVVGMVRECMERGSSRRQGADRAFVEETCPLAKTLDLIHGCEGHEITLSTPTEWTWRVKNFEVMRRKIREDRVKEADFQRRYRSVKKDVVEILGDIGRCEDWEDKMESLLWDEIRSTIESLPRRAREKCVVRLIDDGILDREYEL